MLGVPPWEIPQWDPTMGFMILKIPFPYGIFLKIPMGFFGILTTILMKIMIKMASKNRKY